MAQRVGGYSNQVTASFTRPNDTNAYASGDVVCNSTSAPACMTFDKVSRDTAKSAVITGAILVDSANQATKLDADLFLFHTTLTPDADNAAFTPTDAEMLTCIGTITISGSNAKSGDATSGTGGNCITMAAPTCNIPFRTLSNDDNLYGVLVARNAYTPVADEVFTVKLLLLQD